MVHRQLDKGVTLSVSLIPRILVVSTIIYESISSGLFADSTLWIRFRVPAIAVCYNLQQTKMCDVKHFAFEWSGGGRSVVCVDRGRWTGEVDYDDDDAKPQ